MDETISQEKKAGKLDWTYCVTLGLAIGLAVPVHRAVLDNLEPSLGYWWSLLFSLSAAGLVGALVGVPFSLYRKFCGSK